MFILEPEMPDHDLDPPQFSKRALEHMLSDWTAVKAMLTSGCKKKDRYGFSYLFVLNLPNNNVSGSVNQSIINKCLRVSASQKTIYTKGIHVILYNKLQKINFFTFRNIQ